MSNQTSDILNDAYDLIENNDLESARALLEPLLIEEPNNPAVWWVYAHAVEDSDEGVKALEKVIQLDPTYAGATELKTELNQVEKPNLSINNWDDLEHEQDQITQEEQAKLSRMRLLLFLIIIILVIVGLFAVLSTLSNSTATAPTEVASNNTVIPTIDAQMLSNTSGTTTEEPEPTETSVVIPTSTTSATSIIASTLGIEESAVGVKSTLLGETFSVSVCSELGAMSSIRLNETMDQLIESDEILPDNIEAVAVILVNCDDPDAIPRTIGVARSYIKELIAGNIEIKEFQRQWQPLP